MLPNQIILTVHGYYRIYGFGQGCGACVDGLGQVAELIGHMCRQWRGTILHIAVPVRKQVLKIRPVQDFDKEEKKKPKKDARSRKSFSKLD